MKELITNISIITAALLLLFVIAELLFHKLNVKAEQTRKLVHFGTGILTMFFPVLLSSHWEVLFLCASFLVILFLSKKFNFLKSINAVSRKTHGSVLFPIVVYICFIAASQIDNLLFYYIPILILSISDPIAALVGKRFPYGKYTIANHTKTLVGSLGFLLSAFVITCIAISYCLQTFNTNVFFIASAVAFTSAFAEALCKNGWDNFTIPFIAALGLYFLNVQELC